MPRGKQKNERPPATASEVLRPESRAPSAGGPALDLPARVRRPALFPHPAAAALRTAGHARLRARLRALARFPLPAGGKSDAPWRDLVLFAPLLCRHSLPSARRARRHLQGVVADFGASGVRRRARRDTPDRMAAVVRRYTKNPVGAHYGLGDWLLQRLTAVVMLLYTLLLLACLLMEPPSTDS